jgi:hypothetical protein
MSDGQHRQLLRVNFRQSSDDDTWESELVGLDGVSIVSTAGHQTYGDAVAAGHALMKAYVAGFDAQTETLVEALSHPAILKLAGAVAQSLRVSPYRP